MTVASRILGALARLPPPTTGAVSVERDLRTTMTDGVVLLADRWHPLDTGSPDPPVILLRTPYGRRQWAGMIGRLFAERGYQVIVQSCRGTFGSGGTFVPFRDEEADGRSTLDWIARQPWFTDRLATFGPSYLGLTQWALAGHEPEFLRAMAMDVTASDFRDAVVYPSDCFAMGTSLTWLRLLEFQERGWWSSLRAQRRSGPVLAAASDVLPVADADVVAVGRHVPFFQDWLSHENPDDNWWDPVRFGRQLDTMPPVSLVGGWYDIFLPSQIDDFLALRARGRQVRLTVGPWSHSSPGTIATSLRDGLDWFDRHLTERPAVACRTGVRVYVMGARRWVDLPDWPPPAEEQLWYLGPGGTLQRSLPDDSPPDRYRYDPTRPTPGIGGPSLNWSDAGPKAQQGRESRPDVLIYTSDTLTESLTVIGPLTAEIHLRSSLDRCDVFVRLCDVSPRRRSRNLSDGIVRLKPGDLNPAPDRTRAIQVRMWPTAITFRPGHRIRLQVSSGAHPLFIRNTGTGEPLTSATTLCSTDQEVFHDAQHRSVLRLPVTHI
jgi:putative CocE/NonD family hydrolase